MKLNDIDLNKLAVFIEVAAAGGISSAAARLRLTPSAVSQSVKSLEESLDVRLFDRVGKRFVLTKAGSELFSTMERYQAGLSASLRRIRPDRRQLRGHIRLGIFYGFSNVMTAKFLAALHEDHPEIEIDVFFGAPSDLDRLVSAKRLDFAINLFQSSADLELKETPLAHDELWLVSAKPPPRRKLDLDELRKAPFIDYYRKSKLISAWINHHFGKRIREVPVVMNASHSELVVQLILSGVGIGIVASSIAKPYVEAGKLHVIRGKRKQLESTVWLKEQARASKAEDGVKMLFRERALHHFATGRGDSP